MTKLIIIHFIVSIFLAAPIAGNSNRIVDVAAMDSFRIMQHAGQYLLQEPVTVTAEYCDRSAGGVHDYYSEGDYWWPDSSNPNGPYIRRDGLTNPDNFVAHRKAMRRLSLIVPGLVAAYKLTGDKKYALKALKHLDAWFVNSDTRMNPNLLYAQAIKGKVTGRGIGIIDTIHLVEVAQAIRYLEESSFLNNAQVMPIKKWFADYLKWMTTFPFGIKERDNGNNHSTCWAMQVAAFACLTGDQEQLDYVRKMYREVLVPQQMAVDGSFPKELERTKPYGYMLFNLDAMAMVCFLASVDNDLWHFETPDGCGMRKAMEFMFPFIADKTSWPYPDDVMYFDKWPVRHPSLLFSGLVYNKTEYIALWKTLDPDPVDDEIIRNYPIRQPLLWLDN